MKVVIWHQHSNMLTLFDAYVQYASTLCTMNVQCVSSVTIYRVRNEAKIKEIQMPTISVLSIYTCTSIPFHVAAFSLRVHAFVIMNECLLLITQCTGRQVYSRTATPKYRDLVYNQHTYINLFMSPCV